MGAVVGVCAELDHAHEGLAATTAAADGGRRHAGAAAA